MATEIDHIEIRPDSFGWTLRIYLTVNGERGWVDHGIGDAMQFVHETERTLGRWLADGPADFHNATVPTEVDGWPADPDLVRDLERGK